MITYTLGSSSFVHAPGLIAWAINGAALDRKKMIHIVASTWSVPEKAVEQLLLKKVPFTVTAEDAVQFEVSSK